MEKLGQEDAYVSDCVAALRVEIECAVSLLLHQVIPALHPCFGNEGGVLNQDKLSV